VRRSRPGRLRALVCGALVVLAGLAGTRAEAQTFGAKGGLNLANLVIDEFDTSAKASAVAGGFVRLPLLLGIGLQAEGLIAQRRVTFEDTTVRDELNYLEIPLLARRRVMTVGSRSVHVLGGVVVGIRLGAKEIISGEAVDVEEVYKPTDVGAAIGGEVAITRRWFVDVRYVFGMTNVFDVPGFAAKCRTLQVTVGFGF
jgi:hypothetical protein